VGSIVRKSLCQVNNISNITLKKMKMIRLSRVCGSYEAMEGGFTTDALIDMTGGIEEAFELNSSSTAATDFKEQIKRVLWQAYLRKSMLGCSITVSFFKKESHKCLSVLEKNVFYF
jgi:hypothetical protein